MLDLPYNPFSSDLSRQPCPLPGCAGHLMREALPSGSIQLLCTDCEFASVLKPSGQAPGYTVLDHYPRRTLIEEKASTSPSTCRVPDCGSPPIGPAHGLCNRHYLRWKRAGKPDLDRFVADQELTASLAEGRESHD